MPEMTAVDYEAYVGKVVSNLNLGKDATLLRNIKFPGLRQPGEYEIDIAVKVRLAGTIDFLLIVECKNWSRPVDRPVVQKLAQTRDAIGAHKAAIASPVGFTKEAVDVAKVHGIALWVLSKAAWSIIMGAMGPPSSAWLPYELRGAFLKKVGLSFTSPPYEHPTLVSVEVVNTGGNRADAPDREFSHYCVGGSAVIDGSNEPGFDPRLAVSQVADACGRLLGMPVPEFVPPGAERRSTRPLW